MRLVQPLSLLLALPLPAPGETAAPTSLDEFDKHVAPFFQDHCLACHGEKKQKADFAIHDIDGLITAGKDTVRWEKALEMLSLGDMPPDDEPRPDRADRARVVAWITAELRKIGRGPDPGKLALPHQANRLDHRELFSGEHKGPAYSPARLWRLSPQIYQRFSNEVRTQISQPFLGLGGKGIQDYASLYADESTIKTMLRNSKLIAANMISSERTHANRFLNPLFKEGAEPSEEEVEKAVVSLFEMIFQRKPNGDDQERYIDGLFRRNRELGGLRIGFRNLIVGMLMSQEFVFRHEVGMGPALPDGRRMLSPPELAYALSYAFHDRPDRDLLNAAHDGRLTTREDVEREVRRILDTPDERKQYWHYPMYHRWGADYYQQRARVLRFFQEFFGYTRVVDVFKDRERNPEHHANRLRKDADFLVLGILARDRDVLKELLTTNHYPMDPIHPDKFKRLAEPGEDRQLEHLRKQYPETEWRKIVRSGKWPGLGSRHVDAYNINPDQARTIRRGPAEGVTLPKDKRAGMLTHPAWLVAHSGNFENDPIRRGKWIREHLLADLVPDIPIGVDAKVPEDDQRTLRQRLDIVEKPECWRCHKQMNPLGIPFEHYDDFGRFRDDIVLGDADAYFKAERKFEHDTRRTREEIAQWEKWDAAGRAEKREEARRQLAGLKKPAEGSEFHARDLKRYQNDHQRWSNELKRWSEMTDEDQAREISRRRDRLASLKPPTGQLVPVDPRGVLRGTGDPALDGPVEDAVDLVHRLAQSERVRQSFVRHAFRYWMGRNETLDDSPTLIAADRAYVDGGGSFKELLVSLLTSDSFLYRR